MPGVSPAGIPPVGLKDSSEHLFPMGSKCNWHIGIRACFPQDSPVHTPGRRFIHTHCNADLPWRRGPTRRASLNAQTESGLRLPHFCPRRWVGGGGGNLRGQGTHRTPPSICCHLEKVDPKELTLKNRHLSSGPSQGEQPEGDATVTSDGE